jgi:5,10-methylenetetrahydrofolate reductase
MSSPSPAAPEAGTPLREKLAAGRFVVTAEVAPPRGVDAQRALAGAALLKEAGVDAVNVGDTPLGQPHMSAMALAAMIQQEVGTETIVHCVTRDRNLLALQGDLLGMHALGLRNVLCLRGDLPRGTGYTRAVGVWDVTPVGLIGMLKGMNEGVDAAGERLDGATSFFIGGAATPTAPLEVEAKLMRRKKEAGVDFVITQPVFDAALVERYVEAVGDLSVPIILGVMPLLSHRNAEFIHREMAGAPIPEEVRERMRRAGDEGPAEGLKIVREVVEAVRDKVSGICVMSSLGRFDVAAELAASIPR